MPLTHRKYIVYADGSCLGNPGPGGWGVVVIAPDGSRREFNGHCAHTTNNQMEISAAIEGLRATETGSHVDLYSDSQYVVNTIERGWKRNANQDLWHQLDEVRDARNVEFKWVRGHASDPLNARADELAVMGAKGRAVAAESTDGQIIARPVSKRVRALDSSGIDKLRALLAPGEELRKCSTCGSAFVSSAPGERYCSRAPCQLESRSRGSIARGEGHRHKS
ncbi:MAG TPA: ribonuclease H [Candidatus Binataceae bacterium]|nr:ribonuclease H [Candidatus Binataceae bacterium]